MRPLAGMTGQPAAAGPMRVLDDEAVVEAAVARVRADPGAIAGADELAASIGLERDRLDRLAIEYFHRPIDELVELSRVEAAASLLLEGGTPEAVGRLVGFEDEVAFGRAFERRMSVDAEAFAATASGEFELHLPPDYPRSAMLAYLGRDPRSPTERVRGDRYRVALRLRDGPVLVEVVFGPKVARCRLVAGSLPGTDAAVLLHARLRARLGLAIDPASFERHVLARPEIAGLVDGRRGLRIPLVGDLFDAIVWVIAGQQVSLAAAFSMRRRLIDGLGERVLELRLPPTAERIAAVDDEELLGFGFSRAKAHALVHVARAIADGALDLDALAIAAATRIERSLLAQRGIGPWSASYVLMRGFGFPDCVPVGDTALGEGLKRFFGLGSRPDPRQTIELMAAFRPHRSLATFHLWRVSAAAG